MFNHINIAHKGIACRLLQACAKNRWLSSICLGVLLCSIIPLAQAATQESVIQHEMQTRLADNTINPFAYSYDAIDYMLLQLPIYYQYSARGMPQTSKQAYFAYKAQAWLHYAKHENSENSPSAAGAYALQAGSTILQALKNGDTNTLDIISDIPETSALMRPDLWATLNALKQSGGIYSAPKALAFSEVALIWAAADACHPNIQTSGRYFQMADNWLQQARNAYVNQHRTSTNIQLEALINERYQQYVLITSNTDVCREQAFPKQTVSANLPIKGTPQNIIIQMLTPRITYRIVE